MATIADVVVGGLSDNGERIKSIVSQRDDLIVYITESGKPGFECSHELLNRKPQTVRAHDCLYANITLSLRGHQRQIALNHLAYALANSLQSEQDNPEDHLEGVEIFLHAQAEEQARIYYAFGSTAAALFFLAPACFAAKTHIVSSEVMPLLFGGMAGCAGAWASVIQRTNKLMIGTYATPLQHGLTGSIRVLLGSLFGVVFSMLCKAQILLSLANDNIYMMGLFGFLAGLNERFVPEMLSRVSEKAVTNATIGNNTDNPKRLPAVQGDMRRALPRQRKIM